MLAGYKVLDFTQIVAGPTTTRLLAEMGAEVIKVEQAPKGDPARLNGILKKGRSGYFIQHNVCKQSLCVNLKTEEGRDIIRGLIPHMDVVVENYSPGAIKRLGFAYEELQKLNSRIIMCSISALGQTGPLSHVPGYDFIAQAYSGFNEVTGERGRAPAMPQAAIGDVSTGVHAFGAIACALLHRERTGEGQYIDVSLLDAYIHSHDFTIQSHSASGGKFVPTRSGAHHMGLAPCGIFQAKDGFVVIVGALDHQWQGVARTIGHPEFVEDPRFRTNRDRVHHKKELIQAIEAWLDTMPNREEAVAALHRERVPAAPVLTIPEVVNHPHLLEREAIRPIQDKVLGDFVLPGFPFRFSSPARTDAPFEAPDLGEHNEPILSNYLDYTADQLERLAQDGILVSRPTPVEYE
jgi:crotonobetainyl-CoA:carnitine CoA-transferase CaiB-like acyl-CoA transferase